MSRGVCSKGRIMIQDREAIVMYGPIQVITLYSLPLLHNILRIFWRRFWWWPVMSCTGLYNVNCDIILITAHCTRTPYSITSTTQTMNWSACQGQLVDQQVVTMADWSRGQPKEDSQRDQTTMTIFMTSLLVMMNSAYCSILKNTGQVRTMMIQSSQAAI